MGKRGETRATRGKLVRALEELESFLYASDIGSVLAPKDIERLGKARRDIAVIESELWNEELGRKYA